VQESCETELCIRRYELWKLSGGGGKMVFLGGSKEILEFFWSGWRVFGAKERALAEFGKNLRIFVDFWTVQSGLGPSCKYFSKTEGPAGFFTNIRGPRQNMRQVQGAQHNMYGIYQISEYFFNRKTCGLGPRCGGPAVRSGPWWTEWAVWTIARHRITGARRVGHYEPPKLTCKGWGRRGR
jgi:hypothetical protein